VKRKALDERIDQYGLTNGIDRHLRSRYEQIKTIRNRVDEIISNDHAYFITISIAPDHYGKSKEIYHRKLKEAMSVASRWIANEDWGDRNGRYHFHALACFKDQYDYSTHDHTMKILWAYGSIDFQPIYCKNSEAIANYIAKLSNHCIKEKTGLIFYSRKKRGLAHAS